MEPTYPSRGGYTVGAGGCVVGCEPGRFFRGGVGVGGRSMSLAGGVGIMGIGEVIPDRDTPLRKEGQLTLEEKKFLLSVERGDLASVRRILEAHPDPCVLNVNCMDPLGRSALLMAIDNENLEMIELLIGNRVETKDALLHAINEEYVEAVEVLLEHEEANHTPGDLHSWEAIDRDTATFTPDITPLILAAHRDNYEIIKILLDRGATLPSPHDVRCVCPDCVQSKAEDSLRHSRSRINAYRALASPSLMAISSKDPILTAFELSWELRRLSFVEHEFKCEYLDLRRQCQNFATALLDHTRSSYELEVLLNYDPTGPAFEHGDRMHLSRLKLAIKYKQKKFCAHSNVQQLLASIWYEGLPGFRRKNIFLQMAHIYRIGLLFPVYSFAYIMAPHSHYGRILRRPFIKFICHSASYVTFLFLLILASQRIETVIIDWFGTEEMKIKMKSDNTTKRAAAPSIVEWMILAWVAGYIWFEIKQLWEVGLTDYVHDMWNIIDFITNSLYVATVALRIVAYFQVQKEISKKTGTANLPRENWDAWDPILIAEGLFATANIFSSLKLVYIFSVNPHLGPLQISLGRMVIDIVKFFFVYTLVLFAFACGMNQLLWYYADLERTTCFLTHPNGTSPRNDSTGACLSWRRFSNLFESSQTLFWASFGLIDLDNFELTGIQTYTRFWGMLMFGCYCVINVVVLLNLLIAMMNHSYQMISEHADVEWKFARSKLWMSYFEDGGTVPPPFNVIPTPKSGYYLFRWLVRKFCGQSRLAKKEHLRTIRRKAKQASERDQRYQTIMRNLVRRYITTGQRKSDDQGVTEDDVNEIKQDISSFRYELIEILNSSGFNTSSARGQTQGKGIGGKKGRQKERRLMKGFNIGLMEGSVQTISEISSEPSRRSPVSKLARLARLASSKRIPNKRGKWRNLVEATRSAKAILTRSRSDESASSSEPASQRSSSESTVSVDAPPNWSRDNKRENSSSTEATRPPRDKRSSFVRRLGTLTFNASRLRMRFNDHDKDSSLETVVISKGKSSVSLSKTAATRTVSAPVTKSRSLDQADEKVSLGSSVLSLPRNARGLSPIQSGGPASRVPTPRNSFHGSAPDHLSEAVDPQSTPALITPLVVPSSNLRRQSAVVRELSEGSREDSDDRSLDVLNFPIVLDKESVASRTNIPSIEVIRSLETERRDSVAISIEETDSSADRHRKRSTDNLEITGYGRRSSADRRDRSRKSSLDNRDSSERVRKSSMDERSDRVRRSSTEPPRDSSLERKSSTDARDFCEKVRKSLIDSRQYSAERIRKSSVDLLGSPNRGRPPRSYSELVAQSSVESPPEGTFSEVGEVEDDDEEEAYLDASSGSRRSSEFPRQESEESGSSLPATLRLSLPYVIQISDDRASSEDLGNESVTNTSRDPLVKPSSNGTPGITSFGIEPANKEMTYGWI